MTFVRHTHSYPIWGTLRVCVSPSDSKQDSFAFLPFSEATSDMGRVV